MKYCRIFLPMSGLFHLKHWFLEVVYWKKMAPKKRFAIRRCSLVGGISSLWRQALRSLSISMMVGWLPVGPGSTCRTLSSSLTYLHATMLSFMIIKDWASEIVSEPTQLNILIYELPWSWCVLAAKENPKRLPLLIMS